MERFGSVFLTAVLLACDFHEAFANIQSKNILGLDEPRVESKYTPVFWHIHKSGGTTLKNFASVCLNLTLASEVGIREGHINDQELKTVQFGLDGPLFVNVDTTTEEGIQRAERLGFKEHPLGDLVVTPLPGPVVDKLFSPHHKAVLLTFMRHPVDRAISQFYYLQKATWEPTYNPKTANMTLMQFINEQPLEINWMTRQLSGKDFGDIEEEDFDAARMFLRKYCWIGMVERMEESIRRFGKLLGWDKDEARWGYCMNWLNENTANQNKHAKFGPDSPEWKRLSEINAWDVELYDYAFYHFRQQGGRHFPGITQEVKK